MKKHIFNVVGVIAAGIFFSTGISIFLEALAYLLLAVIAVGVPVGVIIFGYRLYNHHQAKRLERETVQQKQEHERQKNELELEEQKIRLNTELLNSRLIVHESLPVPLSRQLVESGVLTQQALQLAIEQIKANALPQYPELKTYNNSPTHSSPQQAVIEHQPEPEQLTEFTMPSVDDILAGLAADEYALGVNQSGEVITCKEYGLYSMSLAGMPGSGKTNSSLWIALQALRKGQGTKLLVADPHYHAGSESLGHSLSAMQSSLLAPVATDFDEIEELIGYVHSIGKERIDGKADKTPVLLMIDEFTEVCDVLGAGFVDTMRSIVRQYRKVGIYTIAAGQTWDAVSLGGNANLRRLFSSSLVHRTDRTSANMLLPRGNGDTVEALNVGQAMYRNMTTFETIQVPYCDADTVDRLLSQSSRLPVVEATSKRLPSDFQDADNGTEIIHAGSEQEAVQEVDTTAVGGVLNVKQLKLIEAKRKKMNQKQTLAFVLGCTATKGRSYQEARNELIEIELGMFSMLTGVTQSE